MARRKWFRGSAPAHASCGVYLRAVEASGLALATWIADYDTIAKPMSWRNG